MTLGEHPEWQAAAAQSAREPKVVGIFVDRISYSAILPGLSVDVGYGCGSFFGGGWMEDEWRKKVAALWMLPGDAADHPQSALRVAAPALPYAPDPQSEFHQRALQLAKAAPLSLMARLPDEHGWGSSAGNMLPYSRTVQAYLNHLQEDAHFQHKWRHGVLLVTYPAWFTHEGDGVTVPWSVVKRLRDAEATGDGFLPLAELARTAHELNSAQVQRLAAQFRVMGNIAR